MSFYATKASLQLVGLGLCCQTTTLVEVRCQVECGINAIGLTLMHRRKIIILKCGFSARIRL